MKEICDISEKIAGFRNLLIRYSKRYEEKKNKISVHIKKLEHYLESSDNVRDVQVLIDTVQLLKQQEKEDKQVIDVVKNIIEYVDSLLEIDIIRKTDKEEKESNIIILEAQEQVRGAIARELHDSTVQNLTAISYKVELCSKLLDKDITRVRLELQVILASLKKIVDEVRNTIYNLRPTLTQEAQLEVYLSKYLKSMKIKYPHINFVLEVEGSFQNVRTIYCLTLLRIVQEACQNAVKHSEANLICVTARCMKKKVYISVKDNGIGFDLNGRQRNLQGEHFGLSIMKERAQLLHANFIIQSSKGEGTIVLVEVPEVFNGEGDKNGSN
ncbi:sensor histidine kinase [[Clostridium] polysaccharolyticum]|uniref:Oxygen sensor histidine kinase NreB n=1 Tax=[Clostridium] polysaccharolyticum TaxID=29364 RepID=A0A1I0F4M2_9FIRM|nr:sensor histidine kinase [[Clostridium] polysaccharolyticum]SET52178.1 two-component system, NarL family, sensor histidine kinase DegS [[Clostridium] polysaccharolyticum]